MHYILYMLKPWVCDVETAYQKLVARIKYKNSEGSLDREFT